MTHEQYMNALAEEEGPDFNQEVNLHADTIAERYDLKREIVAPYYLLTSECWGG